MNPQRTAEPKGSGSRSDARKSWKKKTIAQVVVERTDKLRVQIADTEEELKRLRKELQKLEEARKIFEVA